MALHDRRPILTDMTAKDLSSGTRLIHSHSDANDGRRPIGIRCRLLLFMMLAGLLPGCGLVFDAIELVHPLTGDELSAICSRGRLRVGISVEPFRPFVFPAVYTDEGIRVTGLDVQLIQEVSQALSEHCGKRQPILPTLHLTRFRDLLIELNEGHLDLFVSSFSGNVPGSHPGGLWTSMPYFQEGGIGVAVRRDDIADKVLSPFRRQATPDTLAAIREGLSGLTVAVQNRRTAHFYAEANLPRIKLVVCDSLPAAVETKDPPIDVILTDYPILRYVTKRVWPDWRLLERPDGSPLVLTQEYFSIVTSEEKRRLQWFLNNLLYRLEETGRLAQMRRRWMEEEYAPTRRATVEGLPLEISKVPDHYNQGQCRPGGKG
ncbi:MAG: transporter substrate-binding domain-containing protein [Nitrospira sp.]|nr:transporter substrate-binding domain-containing protein [Nitrospira sp.]MCP9463511.1 transporter substrate-binding domain-containing protein [Nitrospira sp.]